MDTTEHDIENSSDEMPPPVPPPSQPGESFVDEGEEHQDVQQDAIAELERIHEAQQFAATPEMGEFDASYGLNPRSFPAEALPYEPALRSTTAQEPRAPTARELRTLEDLYAAYPSIGDGSTYLRVYRKSPTRYGHVHCAGWLCDLHEQMSMSQFADRFGGNTYDISVCGPSTRSHTVDADGRVPSRTLTTIQIKVPGNPVLKNPDDMTASQPIVGPYQADPRVTLKKMDHEAEERRRYEARLDRERERARNSSNISPEILEAMERSADKRGQAERSAASGIIQSLRDTNQRLAAQISEKDAIIETLRSRQHEQQIEHAREIRDEETRQVRELKERNNNEIARMKEEHASRISQMQTEHQRVIADVTERATRERDHLQKMEQIERDRIRSDALQRETQIRDDYSRREKDMRDSFESRIRDLDRSNEREMRGVRDMRDREIESIRSSESGKAALSEKTGQIHVGMLQAENARLSVQLDAISRELDAERQENKPKPLIEQVSETKAIAETLGLLDKDEEFDWKKAVAQGVNNVIDQFPKIAEGLGAAREQNRQAVERAQHASRIAHARAQQARARHGHSMTMATADPTPPPTHRPAPPPGMQSPPTWDSSTGPPAPGESTMGMPPVTAGEPRPDPAVVNHMGSPPPQAPAPPPFSGAEASAPNPDPPSIVMQPPIIKPPPGVPVEPTSKQQVQESDSHQPAPPLPSQPQITMEQINEFSVKLEQAIQSDLITPAQFARGFVDEVGPGPTHQLISRLSADQLVDSVAAEPHAQNTEIVTRKGRKYVNELWDEVKKILAVEYGGP